MIMVLLVDRSIQSINSVNIVGYAYFFIPFSDFYDTRVDKYALALPKAFLCAGDIKGHPGLTSTDCRKTICADFILIVCFFCKRYLQNVQQLESSTDV